MSSDLVRRLMTYGDGSPGGILLMREAAARIEALEGEVAALKANPDKAAGRYAVEQIRRAEAAEARAERLRVALGKIEQDDYDRIGRHSYDIINGRPSKNDTCDHGHPYWDGCNVCRTLFARKALEDKQ